MPGRLHLPVRLYVIFGMAIVLPSLLLAYWGLSLVEDERAQLSKDQQRIGFSLILALDEMLDRALSDSASGLVEERVLMDGEGRFLVPKVASDRSSGWVPMEGEREEFGKRRLQGRHLEVQEVSWEGFERPHQGSCPERIGQVRLQGRRP